MEKLSIRRISVLFCFIIVVCFFLAVRIYDLSVYPKDALVLSGQYTRNMNVASHTGFIYDRNMKLISHTQNGAVIIVNPVLCNDKNEVIEYICSFSKYPQSDILTKLSEPKPFSLLLDSYPETPSPKGVFIYYNYIPQQNNFCRHIFGYCDKSGKAQDGIYKMYETILDGFSGKLSYKYSADALGGALSEDFCVYNKSYTSTNGLVLTIDREIQKKIDEICDKDLDMGAVIVSDIKSGDILAVSSRPLYDKDNIALYIESNNGEFINRAFSLYTPGSVFKTAVAATGLEIDEKYKIFEYECTGCVDVNGKTFNCHKKDGHGIQSMKDAFANSCNTYFITLANEIGFENIVYFCKSIGIGENYAIDGFLVEGANIPDITKKYSPAYKANFSFGQGDLLLSPVDILNLFSVCSSGYTQEFSIVKGIYREENKNISYLKSGVPKKILKDETVNALRDMMRECVLHGTGMIAKCENISVGGKTATAQSGQFKDGSEVLHRSFAGVFPVDNPKYCVVVLCDGNGNNKIPPALIFSKVAQAISAKE